MKSNWLAAYGPEINKTIIRSLALSHARDAGPDRKSLEKMLTDWDLTSLARHAPSPTNIAHTPLTFFHSAQVAAFFKKNASLDFGVDLEGVAMAKFLESEIKCKETNHRLRACRSDPSLMDKRVAAVYHGAQRKIARVLGDVPAFSALKFRFGPGATTSLKANTASARYKLGGAIECSNELRADALSVLLESPVWSLSHMVEGVVGDDGLPVVKTVPGKLQFVPKDARSHRAIIVEPVLNSYAQLGIGAYLKRRLLHAPVNLYDQTRNQQLARHAHHMGLATIDLSSASDLVSYELVWELLPYDWAKFLTTFRTGRVAHEKIGTLSLSKFSSMGNGFTFELETLIFWALSEAVCDLLGLRTDWNSVYGDDIIIPADAYPLLNEVFTASGFKINEDKSFTAPPFFESCGTDWFYGIDVRPYFLKQEVTAEVLFTLHNYYVRNTDRERARAVKKLIHPSLRIYGPDGFGDGHLLGPWHPKRVHRDSGWAGYIFDTFSRKPSRKVTGILPGDRAIPAYAVYIGASEESPFDIEVVRGSSGRYKRTSIYTLTT